MPSVIFKKNLPTIKQLAKLLFDEALRRTSNNQVTALKMVGMSRHELDEILTEQEVHK